MNTEGIPRLTEPGVTYFLRETLKHCNTKKTIYYNAILNLGLLFIFISLLGILLIYKKRTKLTPEERASKKEKQRLYILEKIKSLREQKRKQDNETITSLPKFESNFVQLHKNYYKI